MDKLKNSLPNLAKPLFWSYNVEKLDLQKHQRRIITQIINYGDLSLWRWLIKIYGLKGLKETLTSIPASELRPPAKMLATTMLGIKNFNYAPRGSHPKS